MTQEKLSTTKQVSYKKTTSERFLLKYTVYEQRLTLSNVSVLLVIPLHVIYLDCSFIKLRSGVRSLRDMNSS